MMEKIASLFGGDKKMAVMVLVATAGVILIALSSFDFHKKPQEQAEKSIDVTLDVQSLTKEYKNELERQLEEILSGVRNAGNVDVMLTIGSTAQIEYACNEDTNQRTDGGEYSKQLAGSENPIIAKVNSPKVCGALVVCDGGGDPKVKEDIYKAVGAVLGLPTSSVCVCTR